MQRRTFIRGLSYGLGFGLASNIIPKYALAMLNKGEYNLPILMFHKVTELAEYPEDISSEQLSSLFKYLWENKFYPVNISDILDNQVDKLVPKGYKAIGITADDAHRSIVFSKATVSHPQQNNTTPFIEIFKNSLLAYNYQARASFFISAVADDRYSKEAEGYFGSSLPLQTIINELTKDSGIEIAYHTRIHKIMKNMDAKQVNEIITDQMQDFKNLGVFDQVKLILSYPYGVAPIPEGVEQLKKLGFKGAVLAFPGEKEAAYGELIKCSYNKELLTDPFFIPRVGIGAYTYAPKEIAKTTPYLEIDPIEDFKKDVEKAYSNIYTV